MYYLVMMYCLFVFCSVCGGLHTMYIHLSSSSEAEALVVRHESRVCFASKSIRRLIGSSYFLASQVIDWVIHWLTGWLSDGMIYSLGLLIHDWLYHDYVYNLLKPSSPYRIITYFTFLTIPKEDARSRLTIKFIPKHLMSNMYYASLLLSFHLYNSLSSTVLS